MAENARQPGLGQAPASVLSGPCLRPVDIGQPPSAKLVEESAIRLGHAAKTVVEVAQGGRFGVTDSTHRLLQSAEASRRAMSSADDYYRILGVDSRAERATIHRAYRELARLIHPDVIGDDTRMKFVNVAWDVLGDAVRRASYDQERAPVATTIAAPATMTLPRHAGPPPGRPSGSVLTYGRYEGWSLGEIVRVDPTYLEWLRKAPGYRWLQSEVDGFLGTLKPRAAAALR
jgi:hypothetical protein